MTNNPLLSNFLVYKNKFIPFHKIKTNHFIEAFTFYKNRIKNTIDTICKENDKSFNIIKILEKSYIKLNQVSNIYFTLLSTSCDEQLNNTYEKINEILCEINNNFIYNNKLFNKISYLQKNINNININNEEKTLINNIYKSFKREGSELNIIQKQKLCEINKKISLLEFKFGDNILNESNNKYIHIKSKKYIKNLPLEIINEAEYKAKTLNVKGFVFPLKDNIYREFMKYCNSRYFRKKMFLLYGKRCNSESIYNNIKIIQEILDLKRKKSQLLGYTSYAEYILEDRMLKNKEIVLNFLHRILKKSIKYAKNELNDLKKYAYEKDKIILQQWDLTYYLNKFNKDILSINEDDIKYFFEINNCIKGFFTICKKMYGIKFKKSNNINKYHKDIITFEVYNCTNIIAILYIDPYARDNKKSGAWMCNLIDYSNIDNKIIPHILTVFNFIKPTKNNQCLLKINDLSTLFHELGHAIHAILADTQYPTLSGTNVTWDFVEMPSQFYENMCYENECLKIFAKHVKNKKFIDNQTIEKIKKYYKSFFWYNTIKQIQLSLLDINYHINNEKIINIEEFERNIIDKYDFYKYKNENLISPSFTHIFHGSYAAGYYSYKWAEVIACDAIIFFKKNGGFFKNKNIINKFKYVLSKGGTIDPTKLYTYFNEKGINLNSIIELYNSR